MSSLPHQTTRQPEFLIKTFYFLYFAAVASLFPFLGLFYEQLGMSGRQIGVLTAIPPLVTLFAASFWGGLADATQQYRPLLALALAGVMALALAVLFSTTFLGVAVSAIILAVFFAPIVPLVDNSTLEYLGEQKKRYGKLRLWGAIGWGLAAPVVGRLVEQFGLGWSFYSFILFMFAGLLISFRLPITSTRLGQSFGQGMQQLLVNHQWRFFLTIIFMIGMGAALIHNYLFLYMEQLGASKTLMGLALSAATLSEAIVFSFVDRLLDRWGAHKVLMLTLLAVAVRLIAYALLPNPWLVLPVQLLHGLTFATLWAAGVAYANKIAPPGLGATAQGLMSAVSMGAAGAAGAFIGGLLYQSIGLTLTFGLSGLGLLVALLFCLVALPAQTEKKQEPLHESL